MKTVAIMQPTYLPWLGYFALLDQADTFVFLDNVQFARRSWQQRNRIKNADGELMLTVPVKKKGKRDQLIKDVEIDYDSGFARKHIGAISSAYRRCRYFNQYADALFGEYGQSRLLLSDFTINLIQLLQKQLGIECEVIRSSQLSVNGAKDELLAGISEHLSATTYLSAVGSKVYLEESTAFSRRGIDVQYNEYNHPVYSQPFGDFCPYMAVIDVLFNAGPDSLKIIREGYPIKVA